MLMDELTSDLVLCRAHAGDWRGAVRLAGSLLERAGACDPSYTESMVASVEKFGPYMVLEEGIAMPHAQAAGNVSHPAVCVVTLADPVPFGHEEFDPVGVLIGVCAPDPAAHLASLAELSRMFEDEDAVGKLLACESAETVLAVMGSLLSA